MPLNCRQICRQWFSGYPFSFIADAWEEVFWRETEEIRHAVASLLKTMGKEASRKEDFVAAALVARSDGT